MSEALFCRSCDLLTVENHELREALRVRSKQIGVACDKHDLIHALECGYRYKEATARLERLESALRELWVRADSFWAYLQGEHNVKLSASDHDDHNVCEYFAAMSKADAALETKG